MVNSLMVETHIRNKAATLTANKARPKALKAATAVSSSMGKGNTDRPVMAQPEVPMVCRHHRTRGDCQADYNRRR